MHFQRMPQNKYLNLLNDEQEYYEIVNPHYS